MRDRKDVVEGLRFLEEGNIVEDFWQDEIEERPELFQVVLRKR
jgi:hypothetical protein